MDGGKFGVEGWGRGEIGAGSESSNQSAAPALPAAEPLQQEGSAAFSEKQPSQEPPVAGRKKHVAPWLQKYRYPKGVSGNPSGRPSEGKTRKTDYRRQFREQMQDAGADIVGTCIRKAMEGDTKMIAIAMRYLMPEAKADSGNIDLELAPEATMEQRLAALVNKISSGDVSVEAGAIAAKSLRDITESAKVLEALQRMDKIQAEIGALSKRERGY